MLMSNYYFLYIYFLFHNPDFYFTEPFFLAEPILKIGPLNLLSTEPMFRYRKMLKIRSLRGVKK